MALAAYLPWVTAQGRGLCGPTQARGAIVRGRLRLPVNKPGGFWAVSSSRGAQTPGALRGARLRDPRWPGSRREHAV